MNDHELLELAAKARGFSNGPYDFDPKTGWNPLVNDGDALRIAVKLDLFQNPMFLHERDVLMFTKNTPKLEATRRAIVRAAAEIGKSLP